MPPPAAICEMPFPSCVAVNGRPEVRALAAQSDSRLRDPGLVPVTTLVLWTSCTIAGVLGFWLSYAPPVLPRRAPEPVTVEQLHVELAPPVTTLAPAVAATPSALPPPPAALAQPQIPAAIPVAEPSSAIAFAVPVEGPVRVVGAEHAAHVRGAAPAAAGPNAGGPSVQTLVFGQGEGRQPAPEYPVRAMNQGQEGAVVVRFTVGPQGRVLSADAAQPCAWPLLNDSAVRTIRAYWRFSSGPLRLYEVVIRFQLPK